jgi:hypothetical protein
MVTAYLECAGDETWEHLKRAYQALLDERLRHDTKEFDQLAELATEQDVYIGCSCPTKRNPRVSRCHTTLALQFMQVRYPELPVSMPCEPD